MPSAARANQTDAVQSPHGAGPNCELPAVFATQVGSGNVNINGQGAVRIGDVMQSHPNVGCGGHAPGLSSSSSTVNVNDRGVARLGDEYSGHTILSGSSNVNIGD